MYYGENSEIGLGLWLGFVVGTLCENCCKSLRHLTTTINSARVYVTSPRQLTLQEPRFPKYDDYLNEYYITLLVEGIFHLIL